MTYTKPLLMERLHRKSRMSREIHVRFCESPGVKFSRATRRSTSRVEALGALTVGHPIARPNAHLHAQDETDRTET